MLYLEFYHSPDHVLSTDSLEPLARVPLAHDETTPAPPALVGRSLQWLSRSDYCKRKRVAVEIPADTLSRAMASFRWVPGQGIMIRHLSRTNKIKYRAWGHTASSEIGPGQTEAGLSARLAGSLPYNGLWFRTVCPPADFSSVTRDTVPDLTITPNEDDLDLAAARDLLFCSDEPDFDHIFGPACDKDGMAPNRVTDHDRRHRTAALLLAYGLPSLVWPPKSWRLPTEEVTGVITARYQNLGGTKKGITTPLKVHVADASAALGRLMTIHELLAVLVAGGAFSWKDIHTWVEQMEREYPVTWTKNNSEDDIYVPRKKLRAVVVQLGAGRTI